MNRIGWVAFALVVQVSAATLADVKKTASKFRDNAALKTELKHQLRDWIESRVAGERTPWRLTDALNKQLDKAGLFCRTPCDDQRDYSGYLGEIDIRDLKSGWLLVQTTVGVGCSSEGSFYLYQREGTRWKRRLEDERERVLGVFDGMEVIHVSEEVGGRRLLMVIGTAPQCASTWGRMFYDVWNLSTSLEHLLQGSHILHTGNTVEDSTLKGDEITLGFGVATLRYKVDASGGLRRLEPIADTPALFVDEWLTSTWKDIAEWSDPSLAESHGPLGGESWGGALTYDVQECKGTARTWQVSRQQDHFLVEQRGPKSFYMRGVSGSPFPGCVEGN